MARDEAERRARIEVPMALTGLVAVGAALGDPDDGTAANAQGSGTGPGIETSSRNVENPPPDDLNDDFECTIDTLLGVTGSGTLTNRTSKTSSYVITVVMEVGGVRSSDGVAFVNDVRPGATVEWSAPSFTRWRDGSSCSVQDVDRFAS